MVIYPPIAKALAECQREFEGRAVIVSNSAGLEEFDPEGDHLELGIACIF